MSSDNNNTTNSEFPKTYRGPVKLVWEDGQQVMRPDLEAIANGTPGQLQESISSVANKTLDDVISKTDEIQFSQLKDDHAKYDMIANMVSGIKHRSELFTSYYVKGEFRDLKMIIKDLIQQKKIYLDSKTGNLFEYGLAIRNHLLKFKCAYCSRVLYSEDERTKHAVHLHMARRQSYY